MMVQVSRAEFQAIARAARQAAAVRKDKREAKRPSLPWGGKPLKAPSRIQRTAPIKQVSSIGALKASIVTLLGRLDAKLNGSMCRLGHFCPAWADLGPHKGQVGYHLIPQKRGDAARFLRENVVWACNRANYGEVNNRDLYAKHHESLFGVARMARLWAISRSIKKYSRADLLELRAELRAELEAA